MDYPTAALRILLLEEVHLTYMHTGAPKLYTLLSARYYWPTLAKDCNQFVKHCFACQLNDSTVVAPKWSTLIPLPPGPRHTWAVDLLTDLPCNTSADPKHLIVAVDTFSKFVLLHPLPNKTA